MANDTSNLFSTAEVREIKRLTLGHLTFKHYCFLASNISNFFTETGAAPYYNLFTTAETFGFNIGSIDPKESVICSNAVLYHAPLNNTYIVPLVNLDDYSSVNDFYNDIINSNGGQVNFNLHGYKTNSLHTSSSKSVLAALQIQGDFITISTT